MYLRFLFLSKIPGGGYMCAALARSEVNSLWSAQN